MHRSPLRRGRHPAGSTRSLRKSRTLTHLAVQFCRPMPPSPREAWPSGDGGNGGEAKPSSALCTANAGLPQNSGRYPSFSPRRITDSLAGAVVTNNFHELGFKGPKVNLVAAGISEATLQVLALLHELEAPQGVSRGQPKLDIGELSSSRLGRRSSPPVGLVLLQGLQVPAHGEARSTPGSQGFFVLRRHSGTLPCRSHRRNAFRIESYSASATSYRSARRGRRRVRPTPLHHTRVSLLGC